MKKIKRVGLYISLMMILVLLVVGCTPKQDISHEPDLENLENSQNLASNYPIEIEDAFGNKVLVEKKPETIVSLAPHNTEILFALGLGDKVIGVTSSCDYPKEALEKEVIGDYDGTNLEKIVELNPDLVLAYGSGNEEDNQILRDAGIIVVGFEPESIDSVVADIEKIGKITGQDKEAAELGKSILDKKDEIVEKVKDQEKVRVFYEIWHDPLMAAGKGSFMDELITLAGGVNIAEDTDGAYPQYDLEQLVERDPEVYLTSEDMPDKTVESIKLRSGYESISAIKNDRVYVLDANKVSRPGPRIAEALELVAKSIFPELFE